VNVALWPLDRAAALAIVSGNCPSGFSCAADFPAESDHVAAGMFLERLSADLDPRPFGGFLIVLTEQAPKPPPFVIGGIGFHGGPDPRGRVEVGYGVVPSQQSRGYATRALDLLIECARELGATSLIAEVEPLNTASRTVLDRCGFGSVDAEPMTFERTLSN
jgi:RimJ/RimL family protein N-acetyltransferase